MVVCVVHHHSQNFALRIGGWGVFVAEARSRKPEDHNNGSVDSNTAWYDAFECISLCNGSGSEEFNAYLPKKCPNVD